MNPEPTAEMAPHPGEPHRYAITCERCGLPGMLNVAIVGPDEGLRIEPLLPPTPIEDLLIDVPPEVR